MKNVADPDPEKLNADPEHAAHRLTKLVPFHDYENRGDLTSCVVEGEKYIYIYIYIYI
jgi:hypothetical protein